jgi:F-type H+-transporting ATPase subunit b
MVSIGLDFTLIIQIINFLLLMLAMNILLYRPLRKIIKERNELLARLKNRSTTAKAELENGEAEKDRLNAESLRQAVNLKNEVTIKSREQEKSILAEAQEKALRQVGDSRTKLQQSAAAARQTLLVEIQTLAGEMAEKILGRTL